MRKDSAVSLIELDQTLSIAEETTRRLLEQLSPLEAPPAEELPVPDLKAISQLVERRETALVVVADAVRQCGDPSHLERLKRIVTASQTILELQRRCCIALRRRVSDLQFRRAFRDNDKPPAPGPSLIEFRA